MILDCRRNNHTGRVYYGWYIAGAAFFALIFSMGTRSAFGPFLLPMAETLGVSRTMLSLVVAVSMLVFAVSLPIAGRLVDTRGGRPVLIGGTVLLAAALYRTGRSVSFGELLFWYALVAAIGFAATGHVVFQAILNQWFVKRRGAVLSLLSAGAMGAIGLMTPASALLIDFFGWRLAYAVLALAVLLVILPAALWIIRERPEELGLLPDGDPVVASRLSSTANIEASGASLWEACRTRPFWLLAGGYFACGFSMNLLSTHGVPMLVDHGFSYMEASSALGVLGLVGIAGSVGLGVASDYMGRKSMLALIYLVRALGFLLLVSASTPIQLFALGGLAGLVWVGSSAMTSALAADLYGRVSIGTIFGWIYFVHQVGAAVGAYLGGAAYDWLGTHVVAFGVSAVVLVIAALLSYQIPESLAQSQRLTVLVEGADISPNPQKLDV
jgi:MFS family permease